MDDALNPAGRISVVCPLVLALSALPAAAQALPDPTRPAAGEHVAAGAPAARASVLQSVLVSEGRRVAVIDGQLVPIGGRVGAYRLVSVEPTSVVLQGPGGSRTLRLLDGIGKLPVKSADGLPMKTSNP